MSLRVEQVSKTFRTRRDVVRAVDDVSVDVGAGEVLALLGPNGAGKTTLIKMIAGIVLPDTGRIRVAGRDPHADRRALREVGAVLEGNRNVYWRYSALENLAYLGALKGVRPREARRRGRELLARLRLDGKADALVSSLSRGMQQKLAIAAALLHDPAVLLLDEPTLGLDVEAAADMKAMLGDLRAEGRSIVLTTHQLDVAQQVADRVAMIRDGRLVVSEAAPALLARFSTDRYVVRLAEPPPAASAAALAALDGRVEVEGAEVRLPRDAALFHRVMAALAPRAVVSVAVDEPSLEQVFLRLAGGRGETVERTVPA